MFVEFLPHTKNRARHSTKFKDAAGNSQCPEETCNLVCNEGTSSERIKE